MKKIFLLICILLSIKSFSQDSTYKNFRLELGNVYYENVYNIDSLDNINVERLLTLNVPKLSGIRDFNKSNEIITATISGNTIDYRKYGGKWGNTWAALNHPFCAKLMIVWKDNRYKVTISDIKFQLQGSNYYIGVSETFTKKKGTQYSYKPILVTAYDYIDKYFTEYFDFRDNENDKW